MPTAYLCLLHSLANVVKMFLNLAYRVPLGDNPTSKKYPIIKNRAKKTKVIKNVFFFVTTKTKRLNIFDDFFLLKKREGRGKAQLIIPPLITPSPQTFCVKDTAGQLS